MDVKEKKTRRFIPILLTLAALILTIGLTTIYFEGIQNPSLFPSNILVLTLVNVNLILVVLLILLLSRNLIKLYFERRHKLLGATFRIKLISAFVGLSLIPSVLLFIVASKLINDSIENWFSGQIENSLDASLEVAQTYYQETKASTLKLARNIEKGLLSKKNLSLNSGRGVNQFLEGKRREYQVDSIGYYSTDFNLKSFSDNPEGEGSNWVPPPEHLLKGAIQGQQGTHILSKESGDLVQVVVPILSPQDQEPLGILVVNRLIPRLLVDKMGKVTKAFEDYKLLQAFKNPIRWSYLLSFLIMTLLIIFSATWFGFYLAKGITVPIQKLVEGTQAVAQGDLDFRIDARTSDEIGHLVNSFNQMTEDLRGSKTGLETANQSLKRSNLELDQRRAYTETILENIATGVISINNEGKITTFNRSAEKILEIKADVMKNQPYEETLRSLQLSLLNDLIQQAKAKKGKLIQQEVQIDYLQKALTLRVKISNLVDELGQPQGIVVTFDDLTELIKAQKVATWQEVARRMAHEIKNPLTPIQLSAQRLRKKFLEGATDFPTVLDDSTQIIIKEVRGLKTLVDEFSNFARMPAPTLLPCDLYEIIQEVVILYQGIHRNVQIIYQGPNQFPFIHLDREQIKRVFINLFENAIHAMGNKGRLWITASLDERDQKVRVEVADEGVGIHQEDFDKLFIPYFSKKKAGTGLGLAIVHRIVSDHNGHIRATRNTPKGTNFVIELPVIS